MFLHSLDVVKCLQLMPLGLKVSWHKTRGCPLGSQHLCDTKQPKSGGLHRVGGERGEAPPAACWSKWNSCLLVSMPAPDGTQL